MALLPILPGSRHGRRETSCSGPTAGEIQREMKIVRESRGARGKTEGREKKATVLLVLLQRGATGGDGAPTWSCCYAGQRGNNNHGDREEERGWSGMETEEVGADGSGRCDGE